MDDSYSIGQASAAVAMANDAIFNARRAAASSRSRRAANSGSGDASMQSILNGEYNPPIMPTNTPQTPQSPVVPGTAEFVRNDVFSNHSPISREIDRTYNENRTPKSRTNIAQDLDLKNNDNAYHVVATLITDRLLPKLSSASPRSHPVVNYTVTSEDIEFFSQMLPFSVRQSFVHAVRHRLKLLKNGGGNANTPVGRLTLQCQMLGLNRQDLNVLLDLGRSDGMSYPVDLQCQSLLANGSAEGDLYHNQYRTTSTRNDGNFGLSSPMTSSFSPSSNFSGLDSYQLPDDFINAESLARQQIMAEITETKFLMRGSVTPEAVSFWKKHYDELSQRLVALNQQEQTRAAAAIGRSYDAEWSCVEGATDLPKMSNMSNAHSYRKVKEHYVGPTIASREEYLEKNRKMREEAGMVGGMQVDPKPEIMEAQVDIVGNSIPLPKNKQQEELPLCDVVAPSDLPGGYMFEAQLGTKKFLATVPPGGVFKGQRFVSTMKELETIEIPVALGAWRDESYECFNHGLFHPLFLNTVFFPCISLGQIMTRTGLDWQGEPANRAVSGLSCVNMSVILTFWIAMNSSALFMLRVEWERGMELGLEFIVVLILFNAFTWLYLVNVTRNVRESIRHKYQIPEERCIGCEDCLCATFCMSCTICHMGRHTADFDTYRGTFCTRTGLPRQVELAEVTLYDSQYHNVDSENIEVV